MHTLPFTSKQDTTIHTCWGEYNRARSYRSKKPERLLKPPPRNRAMLLTRRSLPLLHHRGSVSFLASGINICQPQCRCRACDTVIAMMYRISEHTKLFVSLIYNIEHVQWNCSAVSCIPLFFFGSVNGLIFRYDTTCK